MMIPRIRHLAIASILLLPLFVTKASPFEGTVQVQFESHGEQDSLTFKARKGKVRFEHPEMAGMGYGIMDFQNNEMVVVIPSQRMYMRHTMEEDSETDDGELERTGETLEILGHRAELYIYRDSDSMTEIWVTDELGRFFISPDPSTAENQTQAMRELLDRDVFLLKVVSRDLDGNLESSLEVTDIRPGSIPASEFEIPGGFREMQMPTF